MEFDELQRAVVETIDGARALILDASHRIHARPEVAKEERFASGLLRGMLESFGFRVEEGYAGIPTAFLATKGDGKGPRVAFLAEYDALPGIGHGCGHNLICSAALGAGIGLGAVMDRLGGEVLVFGTPAEETDGAKVALSAKGCFDGLDAALMIHPYAGNYWMTESLAMDALEVEFFGKSSHAAASPWTGVNALDAAILLFTNVNALRQQVRPDARIHGIIKDGGTTPNVIPDHATARFYLRASTRGYLDELVAKFRLCAEASALATGARMEIRNYEESFDDVVVNESLSIRMRDYMTGALGAGAFERLPDNFGSIDLGNVSHRIPVIHTLVDITGGRRIAAHTVEFRDAAVSPYADEAMLRAAKGLALTGLDVLRDPSLRSEVRAEFARKLGHQPKG
jgi:amidohydrolase